MLTLHVLFFAVVATPLAFTVSQYATYKAAPRRVALVAAFGAYVIDEFIFLVAGRPYYYYHVLAGAVVLSVVTGLLCVLETHEKQPSSRLALAYSTLAFGLIVTGVYLYWYPENVSGVVAVNAALVLVVNGVVLIRSVEDRAVPYLGLMSLWAVRHFGMYQQWPVLNAALSGAFFVGVSGYIIQRVRRATETLIADKDFLIRARDVVVTMLYDISSEKSLSSVNYTLVRVLEVITEALAVEGAAVYIRDERPESGVRFRFSESTGVLWTMQMHGHHGGTKTTFMSADLKRESYAVGEGLVGMAAQRMEPIELDRGHDRLAMRELGLSPQNIRNVLAVPLHVKDTVLGVLVVQNRKNKSSFSPEDARLLEALTEQAAISINNARMYEELARTHRIRQEMSIATDMQKQLLPKEVPTAAHLRVHPFIRPAKEVGGDYYDFVESGKGQHALVIGDVSGKGLPAGIIMVIARTTLQIVARGQTDTKTVLTRFAQEMYPRMRRGQFMTLNFLLWDDEARTLRYSAAGHEHILWYRGERSKSERIKAGGVAVGLLEDPSKFITESVLQAKAGDVFVLYTDGMTEARNGTEEMFTLNRLQESLDKHAHLQNPELISRAIIDEVSEFIGSAEQYDDMTLLVATVT